MPGVSVHWGCVRGGSCISDATAGTEQNCPRWRGAHGALRVCRGAGGPGLASTSPPALAVSFELCSAPTCISVQQEGSARTQVTPAAPSAADGCALSPAQIPSSPLVCCLCLGTLRPNSPHTTNGVSVSRPVESGRL